MPPRPPHAQQAQAVGPRQEGVLAELLHVGIDVDSRTGRGIQQALPEAEPAADAEVDALGKERAAAAGTQHDSAARRGCARRRAARTRPARGATRRGTPSRRRLRPTAPAWFSSAASLRAASAAKRCGPPSARRKTPFARQRQGIASGDRDQRRVQRQDAPGRGRRGQHGQGRQPAQRQPDQRRAGKTRASPPAAPSGRTTAASFSSNSAKGVTAAAPPRSGSTREEARRRRALRPRPRRRG